MKRIPITLLLLLSACTLLSPEPTVLPKTGITRTIKPSPSLTPSPIPPTHTPTPSPTAIRPANISPLFDLSKLGTVETDLTYCTADDLALKMDLYYPTTANGPWPVVVYMHGGGFRGGDKANGSGFPFIQPLVDANILVASLNYRLLPDYKFPAPLEDVKCAIRALRANANIFNLDPNRIGAYGTSVGGYLASFLALTGPSDGFEGNSGYPQVSSAIQAAASLAGPADFTIFCNPQNPDSGECPNTKFLSRFSPAAYIHPSAPPILLIHGDQDEIVPVEQSQSFHEKLTEAGVSSLLIIVKDANHDFSPVNNNIEPTFEELLVVLVTFFENALK
ncbi:MAG: alpha/beta hydrolase [Anaerolineae bacterium]|nr:alpha/beta hydrolase [Anaerolineae bacterium]